MAAFRDMMQTPLFSVGRYCTRFVALGIEAQVHRPELHDSPAQLFSDLYSPWVVWLHCGQLIIKCPLLTSPLFLAFELPRMAHSMLLLGDRVI
jgi:hypothetical protein